MKLFIPTIGTLLRLERPWTFPLYMEYRNKTAYEHLGLKYAEHYRDQYIDWEGEGRELKSSIITIPERTVLRVDRIYIRKGADEFDSLTFYWKGAKTEKKTTTKTAKALGVVRPGPVGSTLWTPQGGFRTMKDLTYTQIVPAKPVRFWAKLADVNCIEAEVVTEDEQ